MQLILGHVNIEEKYHFTVRVIVLRLCLLIKRLRYRFPYFLDYYRHYRSHYYSSTLATLKCLRLLFSLRSSRCNITVLRDPFNSLKLFYDSRFFSISRDILYLALERQTSSIPFSIFKGEGRLNVEQKWSSGPTIDDLIVLSISLLIVYSKYRL